MPGEGNNLCISGKMSTHWKFETSGRTASQVSPVGEVLLMRKSQWAEPSLGAGLPLGKPFSCRAGEHSLMWKGRPVLQQATMLLFPEASSPAPHGPSAHSHFPVPASWAACSLDQLWAWVRGNPAKRESCLCPEIQRKNHQSLQFSPLEPCLVECTTYILWFSFYQYMKVLI